MRRYVYGSRDRGGKVRPVSSIYIWSKNFSHSSNQKSEAKYGGNWRSYSTSVSVPCATIALNGINIKYSYSRAGDWNWRTIAFNFRHLWLHFHQSSSYSRCIWSSLGKASAPSVWYQLTRSAGKQGSAVRKKNLFFHSSVFVALSFLFHQFVIGVKVLASEGWSDQDTTGMDLNLSPSNSIRPRLPLGNTW